MNIIDERDIRTIHRKLRKKEYDDMMNLSVSSGNRVRLLDEGMVVDAYGNPLFYIMKGTLEKYLNNLPDDYEGSINLGHMDFATFPILLGKWTKKDMSLVDIGDGRMALDVDLRLDDENFIVKELKRAEYDLAVSAEFGYHLNEEFTAKYGLEILDEIFISDFAIVGEPGNVNSSGIRLKGAKMTVKELNAALEGEKVDLSEINKKLDALLGQEKKLEVPAEEPVAEPEKPAEEPVAEPEEPAEEPSGAEEETPTEEVEEAPAEPENAQEEPSEGEKQPEVSLASVLDAVNGLKEQISKLQSENENLRSQLSARQTAEREFIDKFKELSTSLATESVAEFKKEVVYTDGIGE